jgi:hypothetical protein
VEHGVQEDETELLTLLGQPSSQGFKDPQPDDTTEQTNYHAEALPKENLVKQKTINTLE